MFLLKICYTEVMTLLITDINISNKLALHFCTYMSWIDLVLASSANFIKNIKKRTRGQFGFLTDT
jgi:hypothetical protein